MLDGVLDDPGVLEVLGVRLLATVDNGVEAVLQGLGLTAINSLALRRRVSPFHLALLVPGLCHTHAPDSTSRPNGCAYCRRRGNVFAATAEASQMCVRGALPCAR